jgi:hypothetical protein
MIFALEAQTQLMLSIIAFLNPWAKQIWESLKLPVHTSAPTRSIPVRAHDVVTFPADLLMLVRTYFDSMPAFKALVDDCIEAIHDTNVILQAIDPSAKVMEIAYDTPFQRFSINADVSKELLAMHILQSIHEVSLLHSKDSQKTSFNTVFGYECITDKLILITNCKEMAIGRPLVKSLIASVSDHNELILEELRQFVCINAMTFREMKPDDYYKLDKAKVSEYFHIYIEEMRKSGAKFNALTYRSIVEDSMPQSQ